MNAYGLIVLNKIGNNVTLYANSLKKGYSVLRFARLAIEKRAIQLQWPEVKLLDLGIGKYYLYCINDNMETDGDIQIDIDYKTRDEYFNDLLIANDLFSSPYTDIVHSLTTDDYITELYDQYAISEEENKNAYEKLLTIFANDYNMLQEKLNLFVNPLFRLDRKLGNISSYYKIMYTFTPYIYNPETKEWDIQRDRITYDSDTFSPGGMLPGLYKIVVTLNNELVRSFFWYESTAPIMETRVQEIMDLQQIIAEKGVELANELEEVGDQDVIESSAALLDFDLVMPVFRRPEIETNEDGSLTILIPDHEAFVLLGRTFYVAVLELTELYSEAPHPHKIRIFNKVMQINKSDITSNSDNEFAFYLVDDVGTKLSQLTFVSFDPDYPVQDCINTYRRAQYNRYLRKLYTVFQQYSPEYWNTVSSIAGQYLLNTIHDIPISEFLITQIISLEPTKYRINFLIQLILLCDLQYFTDIDQNFIRDQVYSRSFGNHVFPVLDNPYLIRIITIDDGAISYRYLRSGRGGTEVKVKYNEYTILQCINPETWKSSSIAYYSNTMTKTTYSFYFPKLEVTTI